MINTVAKAHAKIEIQALVSDVSQLPKKIVINAMGAVKAIAISKIKPTPKRSMMI